MDEEDDREAGDGAQVPPPLPWRSRLRPRHRRQGARPALLTGHGTRQERVSHADGALPRPSLHSGGQGDPAQTAHCRGVRATERPPLRGHAPCPRGRLVCSQGPRRRWGCPAFRPRRRRYPGCNAVAPFGRTGRRSSRGTSHNRTWLCSQLSLIKGGKVHHCTTDRQEGHRAAGSWGQSARCCRAAAGRGRSLSHGRRVPVPREGSGLDGWWSQLHGRVTD